MKRLEDVKLTPNERAALEEIRRRVFDECPVEELVLFGSVARGEADEESDIDLLVITTRPMPRTERHETVTELIRQVNLHYDTNFSTLVVDRLTWEEGYFQILPIKAEILKDGVPVWTRQHSVPT